MKQIKKPLQALLSLAGESNRIGLHEAVMAGRVEWINQLLEHGEDINTRRDAQGWSPLHISVSMKRSSHQITTLLIDRGANVNVYNNKGHTPLHYAALEERSEIVTLLLKGGAVVDIRNSDGWTPLHVAVARKSLEVVSLLLDANAFVNARTCKGWTPLHMAVGNSDISMCALLREHGADINIGNENGISPRDMMNFTLMEEAREREKQQEKPRRLRRLIRRLVTAFARLLPRRSKKQ